MYRGPSNSDYLRAPVPPAGFGPPTPPFGPPPFCPPFGVPPGPRYCVTPPAPPQGRPYGTGNENYNRESFFENRPFSLTSDQSTSSVSISQHTPSSQHQLGQSTQTWSTQSLDEQNQEVRKKAEEFLRLLGATESSGDKSEAGERTADKHSSRARSRSRGRSRPHSRSRSRGRSRARSRARSRGKSRARSRSRSRSRSRGKSRTRAKSRARSRSRSRSHGKSGTQSKSQSRLSPKQTYRSTTDSNHSSSSSGGTTTMPDLFHGLRQILQNKELEKHLPLVKSALLRNQSTDETSGMFLGNQSAVTSFQSLEPRFEPETSTENRYGSMLPHERAGGDGGSGGFSNILYWNALNQQPDSKPTFQSVEDEERFLYGDEEERAKPQAVTVPLAQTRSVRSPVHHLPKEHHTPVSLPEPKAQAPPASVPPAASAPTKVTPEECEKVKNLLKTIGLSPAMADICKMAARLKEKKEEQGGSSSLSMVKPALEVLQALSRASRTDDSRSNRSGSSHSNHESRREEKKVDERERERRERNIQKKRKEYLVKELEGLMKQEGRGDLIPVMGFFCQRCEEFFGDMNSAEKHVASHKNKTPNSQEHRRDAKRHVEPSAHRQESLSRAERPTSSHHHQDHSPDRKRIKDERSPRSTDGKIKTEPEDKDGKREKNDKSKEKSDDDDAGSTKSEKKKKKKKKKEKKKKKDKKKAEADKDSP